MVMKVATVDVLTEEAHFEPQVARAIAKAIELEIGSSREELATRGDLTAVKHDLTEMKNEIKLELSAMALKVSEVKGELVRWIFLTVMGQTALIAGVMYFLLQTVR